MAVDPAAFPLPTAPPEIPGLRFRHFAGPADFAGMNEAANESRIADGDDFITPLEGFANYYTHLSNCDPARDILIVDVAGTIAGYARGWWFAEADDTRILEIICFLHPDWRRRGIGRTMLAAMEARMLDVDRALPPAPAVFLQGGASGLAPGGEALLRGAGYVPVRHGFLMIRPTLDDQPDAPLPDGLEIREVRLEHMRAIWEAETEAFRDHWGWNQPTEETYQLFLTDPMQSDTALWRVAWAGDQVAGMVRSFINPELNARLGVRRGWVENISVRRPWRRRGLARALIAASFPLLRARGMTEGALGVDTENPTGALRVYESCGFRAVKRDTVFRRQLAP
jgi:ribosomal protein S18 acetylase RimI-like enzyme